MRINIDDHLIEEAQRLTGTKDPAALIQEGLRALIARESARRFSRLGGSDPRAKAPLTRRPFRAQNVGTRPSDVKSTSQNVKFTSR